MDPNKAYEIGRQGDEQRFRSLIQDALSEGNEAIANWLLDKLKAAHEGSFKDIIEEAVTNANTETEAYKPTDLAKKYWNEYFGPEPATDDHFEVPRAGSPEHLALIEKQNPGTIEKWASNKMKEDAERMKKHFGEEQAEGLDSLLEGLRDTPHDNRW